MRTSRSIDFHKFSGSSGKVNNTKHRRSKLSVPMYSDFFSSVTDNVMCTNTMYGSLQKGIESTLSVYSEKRMFCLPCTNRLLQIITRRIV